MGGLCPRAGALLLSLLLVSPATSSDESRRLTEEGKKALSERNWFAATNRLRAAVAADPKDPEALCWLGINDLREAEDDDAKKEAVDELEKAKAMGSVEPTIDLELGRGCFLVKRDEDCLRVLAAYEKAHPGDWRVPQWQGLALYRLKRYAEAVDALKQALARGSKDPAPAQYHLGLCYGRLKRDTEGVAAFKEVERIAPQSPYAALVRPVLSRYEARHAPARNWWVRARVSGGWDSDGIALGSEALINPGLHRKRDGWFLSEGLEAGNRFDLSDQVSLSLYGGGDSTRYDELAPADFDEAYVGLRLDWRLSRKLSISVTPAYTHDWVRHRSYQDAKGVTPTVAFRWSDVTATVLSYTFQDREVAGPHPRPLDASGHSNGLSLTQIIRPRGTDLELRPNFSYVWSRTEGTEYRYDGGSVGISVSHPIACKIQGTAAYTYSWSEYEDPSVFSLGGAFTRSDHAHTASAALTRPFGEHVTAFIEGSWGDHDSGVALYDYQHNVYTLGVEVGF